MANEVDYNPCQYKGNGLTRDFSFDWKVLNNNEIVVELELVSTGHITKLNIGSDYNVEINEVGGNVTLTTAPTEDYYVNISRETSQYQSKGYSTSTGFQGSEIEKSFDQVSCCLQEMDYNISVFEKDTDKKIEEFEGKITEDFESLRSETDNKISTNKSDTDRQISELTQNVNQQIKTNKSDTDKQISELTENVNQQLETNKSDTDKQIQDFKKEVTGTVEANKQELEGLVEEFSNNLNSKFDKVSDAAEKVDKLQSSVEKAEEAANKATQAVEKVEGDIAYALEQVQQTAQNVTESLGTFQETLDGKADKSEVLEQLQEVTQQVQTELEPKLQEVQDKIKEQLVTATEDKAGLVKPDNETVYADEDGTLRSPKWNLFDIVQKDHVLTFEESKGLAQLGTYVYKEVQDGRYGYPDFYQKCVDEYETLENKKENIYVSSNITGSISDNNGLISGFNNARYATVNQTIVTENAQNPWEFVLKVKMPDVAANCAIIGSGADSQKYGMTLRTTTANKLTLSISGNGTSWNIANAVASTSVFELGKEYLIKVSYSLTGEPENQTATYKVDLKTEKEEVWTNYITKEVTSITSSSSEDTYKIADFTPTLGIDYNVVFTGSIDLNKSYIKINDEIFWIGVDTVAIRTNLNGHKFYDIKDKNKIDEIYQKTGIAWYYGIDEKNQRILLPRISNIILTTKEKIPVIGNGMTFGVTDGQKYFGLLPSGNHYENYIGKCYGAPVGSTEQDAVFASGKSLGVTSDPEKSGIIADLSLVKNKEIYQVYMVVGNTTITQAQTKVTEVTTSENDTLPLFTGIYFDFTPNHVSWLKAGANASGKIYQSAYNELLKISKGEETKYGEGFKVIKETAKLPDTDYSEYWIVNEEEQTFRTPLKTSLLNTISNARILIDKKEPTEEDKSWYNLYSDGWLEQGNWGQPLNSATGRNLVKLLKPYKDTNYEVFASSTAGHAYASASVSSESEIGCETRGHDFSLQQCSVSWITKGYAQKPNVEEISKSQNTGLYFKVANALQDQQLIDCGEVLEELNNKIGKTECKSYVIDTYINEDSGYRVYSDGYCEQWGRLTTKSSGDEKMTVTLLKTYSNTDYKVLTQILDTTDTPFIPWYLASVTNKTVNSFQKYTHPHWPLDWYACGYLAEGEY